MNEKQLTRVISTVVTEVLKSTKENANTKDEVALLVDQFSESATNAPKNGIKRVNANAYRILEEVGTMEVMHAVADFMVYNDDITEIDLTDEKGMANFIKTFYLVVRGFCSKGYAVNFMDMVRFEPYLRLAKDYETEEERKLCLRSHMTGDWKIIDSKAEFYVSQERSAERKRNDRAKKRAKAAEEAAGRITYVECPECGTRIPIENTLE